MRGKGSVALACFSAVNLSDERHFTLSLISLWCQREKHSVLAEKFYKEVILT